MTIYLDHHATTPVDPRVVEAMLPTFTEAFGNPASKLHTPGKRAGELVEAARAQVAALVGGNVDEIVFTSGATEADNLALAGTLLARKHENRDRVVTLPTEHSAVLDTAKTLHKRGFGTLALAPIDAEGFVDPKALRAMIDGRTAIVSVMLANNEVGTIQNLEAIAAAVHDVGAWLHVDAAQGLGYVPFDMHALGVDLVSIASHKIYGPKGVGALAVRKKVRVEPMMLGGGQEGGRRAGTLAVPAIVGFGRAAGLQRELGPEEAERIEDLVFRVWTRIQERVELVRLNGPALGERWRTRPRRHPGNLNLSIAHVEPAKLLLELARADIAVSAGSACATTKATSHVQRALADAAGRDVDPKTTATLRFGLGRGTTLAEVDDAVDRVVETVERLRSTSLSWKYRDEEVPW